MGSDVIYGLQNLEWFNQETHLAKNRDAVGSHGSSSWGSHKTKLDLEIQRNLSRYHNITLRKDTTALREFMGNRVSEILDTTDVNQWHHVRSGDNISDLGTRHNATVAYLSNDTDWQNGNTWMSLPFSCWPVTQDINEGNIPDDEILNSKFCGHSLITESSISFDNYVSKSYQFTLYLTARILKISRSKSFKSNELTVDDIKKTELFTLRTSMKMREKLIGGKLKFIRVEINQDGLITLRSRVVQGLRIHYDADEFLIKSHNEPVAYLWLKKIHDEDQGGITKVVAKSRRKYWIIRARKLATKIIRSCYKCRLRDKVLVEHVMSPILTSRPITSPTFHELFLDIFGPFEINDTAKQKSRKKVWGLVLNCVVARTVHLYITEDYRADAFLHS